MPPRKKCTNPGIANTSKNSEWIPGSKMVFEIPDTSRVSKSRRITQRFTSSLQTIEKERLAYMQDIISPPGVKTRLRRQSLIVSKSIPNVSFSVTNSSVSISVSETKSTPKFDMRNRVSPSKMVTRKKSSDSVSKITSSKSSADHVVAETLRKTRKKSLETNQVVGATKTSNLLKTDEIVAIINNQHANRKRKSDVSVVDPDKKNKDIKIDSQHLTPTDLRRSPRIAKMKKIKTVKNLKEKATNKTFQKNKKTGAKIKNESLIENRAETIEETVDKGEKYAEDNKVENRTPNRKRSPVKTKKEVKSELNKKNQIKESPTKMQTPRKSMRNDNTKDSDKQTPRKSMRNTKESDKKKEMKLSKSIDVVRTKSTTINEITGNRKRGSSAKRKSVRMEEVESEINESPTNVKTSRKRKRMKSAYVDLGEKDPVLIKMMTPKKGTPTVNRNEEDNQAKKVFEKSVALTARKEQAETEWNSVEIENVGKHVEKPKSEKSDAKEERRENSMKKSKKEPTSRRVTRQMASIEQMDSGRKKKKGKKTSPSKMIRGTEFDSQVVNKSQVLSAKSQKTKKSLKQQKSPKTNFSPQSNIFEKEIVSSKSSKKILRKPTPTRGVSCKKISQKKLVASDNESKHCEKKFTNISAEVDFENKPQEPLSSDTILSKSATKKQVIQESIESCKPSSWSFKSLFKNFGKKSSQSESLPKHGIEANENVSTNREMSTEKIPPEKMGLLSVPLLSSTPDVAKNLQEDGKTSFRKSLQKTVSNLSPWGFKKSFEYTRTSIASANNQTFEESVHLQKVEHGKVSNEENTVENNEIQMNVNAAMISNKMKNNKMQFECQESEMELDKKAMSNDDTSTSDSIDIGFNASVPSKKINVYYESQSEDELVVNEESHCSDQEDLISVAKSIHYESQQSEMEDEIQMSKDEILKDDTNVSEELDQAKSIHYESQQSEIDDEIQMSEEILKENDTNVSEELDQAKSIHYESQQSEIDDEIQMSEDDSEEILKDDTNVSEELDQAKSIHYESQQSEIDDEIQMSEDDSEEILKDDTNALEKLDQAKSIHYESQQSEMESETQISEDDSEEILKEDDTNVSEKLDQEENNLLEPENLLSDGMKSDSNSQQLESGDCDIIGKEFHYESVQSNILVSEIENDFKISEKEEEENFDVNDYNASYSNYGLRCIIL